MASLDSPAQARLVSSRSNALYVLPGYLLFWREWRADGRELFYLALDKTLMAMDGRSTATTFESGPPKALFATRTKWIEI